MVCGIGLHANLHSIHAPSGTNGIFQAPKVLPKALDP